MADPPCGSVHPEYPQFVCDNTETHRQHKCWSGSAWVLWENMSYEPLPKPTPKRKDGRKALDDYYKRTGSQTKQDGMEGSFRNVRDDPVNWPLLRSAVEKACRTHAEVSSNEVWDVLFAEDRERDFTYTGDKGFMGKMLSDWARQQGLVGERIGQIENRYPFSHSKEKINLYPSRVSGTPATG